MDTSIQNFQLLNQKWGESQSIGSSGGLVTVSFASSNTINQRSNFDHFITDSAFKNDVLESLEAFTQFLMVFSRSHLTF